MTMRPGYLLTAAALLMAPAALGSHWPDGAPDWHLTELTTPDEPAPPPPMDLSLEMPLPLDPPTDLPIWPVYGPTIDPRPPASPPQALAVVPEPTSLVLLAGGGLGLLARRRRRRTGRRRPG
jgi:hypothetical protein